jgi:hypothetical protein
MKDTTIGRASASVMKAEEVIKAGKNTYAEDSSNNRKKDLSMTSELLKSIQNQRLMVSKS